jgi:hypothetical protein
MFNFKPVPKKGLSSKFPRLKVVKKVNGLIYYKQSRLYLPEGKLRKEMMREYHDSLLVGHWNDKVTTSELSKKYYWPNMKDDVHNYVVSYAKFQMNKHSTLKQAGLLKLLLILQGPYRDMTMDFITSLPKAQGYDAIFMVVDRFSKQARFAPTTMSKGAEHTAKLFFDYWISQKGYPEHIVSDRDVQFQTTFWQYLMKRANTRLTLTTSFHPQGNGQTERINAILNMYLRNFIATDHGGWVVLLPEQSSVITQPMPQALACHHSKQGTGLMP